MGKQQNKKRFAGEATEEDAEEVSRNQVLEPTSTKPTKAQKAIIANGKGTEEISKQNTPSQKKISESKTSNKRYKAAAKVDSEEDDDMDVDIEEKNNDINIHRGKRKAAGFQPLPTIAPGTVVVGRVDLTNERVKLPMGSVLVQFRTGVGKRIGKIDITQVQDREKWTDNPLESLKHGQFVRAVVLKHSPGQAPSNIVELSVRPSLVIASTTDKEEIFEEEMDKSHRMPQQDELVTGYVISATEKGCFVRVTRGITGRVMLKNLSQGFVKDIAAEFPFGKLVAGRVISADDVTKKLELTLRSSVVVGESEQKWALGHLQAGHVVDGIVHRVIPAGILINLPSCGGLTGLCHLSQVFDENDEADDKLQRKGSKKNTSAVELDDDEKKKRLRANIAASFKVGDQVKCLVLTIEQSTKKVALGLKPSYFANLDTKQLSAKIVEEESEDEKEEDEDDEQSVEDDDEASDAEEEEQDSESDGDGAEDEAPLNEIQGEDEADEEEEEEPVRPALTLQQALKATGVDVSKKSTNTQSEQPMSSLKKKVEEKKQKLAAEEDKKNANDDENGDHHTRLNNKRRDALKRKTEAETAELEDRVASNAAPETQEEFERALVSQRNSSLLWIQYLSLVVSMGELEKARALGERALKTISPESEEERNNVWSALLSMELQFGSLDEAKTLFARMIRETNEKWAYLTLCDAYCALPRTPEHVKLAEEAIRGAKKAAKQQSAKVWIRHFRLKFDVDDVIGGRKLLKEALRFVPKHKQVKVMLNFARLEFSHERGDAERGRTIMEGILDNYPKRTDVWHVFIDLETKYGTADRVRTLFQRALSLKMSTKKIKSLFKKWLQFESGPKGGGDEFVEQVKDRAREFVSSLVGGGEDEDDTLDKLEEEANEDGEY